MSKKVFKFTRYPHSILTCLFVIKLIIQVMNMKKTQKPIGDKYVKDCCLHAPASESRSTKRERKAIARANKFSRIKQCLNWRVLIRILSRFQRHLILITISNCLCKLTVNFAANSCRFNGDLVGILNGNAVQRGRRVYAMSESLSSREPPPLLPPSTIELFEVRFCVEIACTLLTAF